MLKNLKISKKMTVGFTAIILITCLVSLYAINGMNNLQNLTVDMYEQPFTVTKAVNEADINILKIMNEMKSISIVDTLQIHHHVKKIEKYDEIVHKKFEIIRNNFTGDKEVVEKTYNAYIEWKPIREEIIKLAKEGQKIEAMLVEKGKGTYQVGLINSCMNILIEHANDSADNFYNRAMEDSKRYITNIIIILLGAFVFAFIIAYFMTTGITKPMAYITKTLNKILSNEDNKIDLTQKIDTKTKDEIGDLGNNVNWFVIKIKDLVSEVSKNSSILSQSSNEISLIMEQTNQGIENIAKEINEISCGLQSNASSVDESVKGIDEMNDSAEIISHESENAFNNSKNVLESARLGGENINEVVTYINKVNASSENTNEIIGDLKISSEEIGEIVHFITAIAEQTNLLALNAAIEAARAGEHGKGFAVVAEEVRKLAESSKESTNKIRLLIDEIQDKVGKADSTMKEGQSLVDTTVQKGMEVNKQFKNIFTSIENMTEEIERILNLSKKQRKITSSMKNAMDDISKNTFSNVSGAQQINAVLQEQVSSLEEVGASIEELNNMAILLKTQTDRFKII